MGEPVTQSHSYYPAGVDNPRHDPTYVEKVADVLLLNRGKRVHIEPIVGGDPWVISEAVNCLRRLGWDIRAERGRPGFVFVRWVRPVPWLRLESVRRDHLGAIVLKPKRIRHGATDDQMELCP
jgi:hypothetical protein